MQLIHVLFKVEFFQHPALFVFLVEDLTAEWRNFKYLCGYKPEFQQQKIDEGLISRDWIVLENATLCNG